MEIDTRFPTKLDAVSDAPERLRSALVKSFPSGEPVRLLVHAPDIFNGGLKIAGDCACSDEQWLARRFGDRGLRFESLRNFDLPIPSEARTFESSFVIRNQ